MDNRAFHHGFGFKWNTRKADKNLALLLEPHYGCGANLILDNAAGSGNECLSRGVIVNPIAKAVHRADIEGSTPSPLSDKMSFKSVNGKILVTTDDIAYIKADGNYAHVFTFMRDDLIMENLLSLEQRLPADIFVRVDRSTIVNITKVYRMDTQQLNCILVSANGRELRMKMTKSGMEKLMDVLG